MLAGLALLALGCQTAQRPASLLPARTAPTLTTVTQAPAPQQQPKPAATPAEPAKAQQPPIEAAPETKTQAAPRPASDPVGDLVAKVEKLIARAS